MWKRRLFALLLACVMLPALAACGGVSAPEPEPGPFLSARRILAVDDLEYDSEQKVIVHLGEVLVFFTYMDTFDEEAWQASTIIQVAWAAEAVNHAASVTGNRQGLFRWQVENGGEKYFANRYAYEFGAAANEIWMLQEEEYAAAFEALMAEARASEQKSFWLTPNNHAGYRSPDYDTNTSFYISSYLPEQLRPNAEAIHMSTQLMREYFPFLGREEG